MPALEALVDEFKTVNTQVLGVSVDSVYCHANWAKSLGGVSFPLLSDFHPKGQVATAYGVYLAEAGITDRATVLIDADGIVRYAQSVTPGGRRRMVDLFAECRAVDSTYAGALSGIDAPGVPDDEVLYVRSSCGFSRSVLLAVENLGLSDLSIVKIDEDESAQKALMALAGRTTVPCLVDGGEPLFESKDIIKRLAYLKTGL